WSCGAACDRRVQQSAIGAEERGGCVVPGEVQSSLTRRGTHPPAQAGVGRETGESARERRRRSLCDQAGLPIAQELLYPADGRRDDRQAGRRGLEAREPESLGETWEDEDIRGLKE